MNPIAAWKAHRALVRARRAARLAWLEGAMESNRRALARIEERRGNSCPVCVRLGLTPLTETERG